MKGQVFSSDMMASVFLFLIVASIVLFAWNSIIDNSVNDMQRKDMEITATRILDILVKTPGVPLDWELNDASVIGLANFDRTIDTAKLSALINMDYNKTRNIFGTPYNYFFKLGNVTKGINGAETVFARRMVLFNNTVQFMELTLSR